MVVGDEDAAQTIQCDIGLNQLARDAVATIDHVTCAVDNDRLSRGRAIALRRRPPAGAKQDES
jgi:hypothetical protein